MSFRIFIQQLLFFSLSVFVSLSLIANELQNRQQAAQ